MVFFVCPSASQRSALFLFFAKKREKRRRNPKPYTAHKGKKKALYKMPRALIRPGERERLSLTGRQKRERSPKRLSLCLCHFQTCFDDDDDDDDVVFSPKWGRCGTPNPESRIARAVSSTTRSARSPGVLDVREHQHERDDQQYDHQRARETRVVVVVVVALRCESVFRRAFREGRWKCTLERRRHHRHRGASSIALFAAATTMPGLSSMKSRFGGVAKSEAGRERESPELRQRLRDAVSSSDATATAATMILRLW